MAPSSIVLVAEAVVVYLLVLWVHSLRHKVGLGPFYALLGGLTVIMSWVTDGGTAVQVGDITFMVGSTVYYTAILLGVFVVYVFDGPGPTRIAILTVAALSAMTPIVAGLLHLQMGSLGLGLAPFVPTPSLRINVASVLTTTADLVFLALAWEFVGRPAFRLGTFVRSFLTLLGVMWLDVALFSTGAFLGTPEYLSIMSGTLVSRLIVATLAAPVLFAYINWQNRRKDVSIEVRPVLAIFQEVAEVRADLATARREIARREAAELELEEHRRHLAETVEERTRELVAANERLVEANETKQRFLADMSHELRTPLNSIIGFSGVLAQGLAGPLTDEQRAQIDMVNVSGRHLLTLIDDVLDLETLESGGMTLDVSTFDPGALAREAAEMVRLSAEKKGLELRVEAPQAQSSIASDRRRIEQVLLNLLGNAIKFTERGHVTIASAPGADGHWVFTVRDSGPGISPDDTGSVFEAFTQIRAEGAAKSKGTGLGLTLARDYARILGGDVTLESRVGVGSTFVVTIQDIA